MKLTKKCSHSYATLIFLNVMSNYKKVNWDTETSTVIKMFV